MRVLICSITYPLPNGVTSSVNESVDGFLAAGHEVAIVAPRYKLGKSRPEHFPVPSSRLLELLTDPLGNNERFFGWRAGGQIKRIIRHFKPDAFWLHTVTPVANTFERVMLSLPQPKVLTYHTMLDTYGKMYFGAIGEQQMIRRSVEVCNNVDAVITPSQFMRNKLTSFGVDQPIHVVASGIEPIIKSRTKAEMASKYGFPQDHKLLIYVGRVVKEKNIAALLKTLKELLKIRHDVSLLLVGPGDIEGTTAEAKQMGINKHLFFTGQVALDEARASYGAANVFVFCSQTETQGLVVGEAMSAGVPVAALNSPIHPEVYPDGTALTVRNEKELAQAIHSVLTDEKLRQNLITTGKTFVEENFSKKIMLEKQIGVFQEVLSAKAVAGS